MSKQWWQACFEKVAGAGQMVAVLLGLNLQSDTLMVVAVEATVQILVSS